MKTMTWEEIEFLVREQTQLLMELNSEIVLIQSDPEKADRIIQPLKDGTIDDGDIEEISSNMLSMVYSLNSYIKLLTFTKDNRAAFSKMHSFLGEQSEENYDRFINLSQKVAADIGAKHILKQFQSMGLVTDNRS